MRNLVCQLLTFALAQALAFAAGPASQTITFGALGNAVLAAGAITLTATSSSGLTVTFASTTPAVCTVSETTATLTALGVCTITASQAGNASWAAAAPVTRSFRVISGYVITTIAGTGVKSSSGDGGPAISASFSDPRGLTVDSAGNIFFVDDSGVRKISAATGVISTVSNIAPGYQAMATDAAGNLYIPYSCTIQKGNPTTGTFTTFAGIGVCSYSGDGGPATAASFVPEAIALDSAGNLYIADANYGVVRKVSVSTGLITTVAGNGIAGNSGDGGAATSAGITPSGIVVDSAGYLYIASKGAIRFVNAATGTISTLVPSSSGTFTPGRLAIDGFNGVYATDTFHEAVLNALAGSNSFVVLAGRNGPGFAGDGALATSANLNSVFDIAADAAGNIYIADTLSHRIRKLTPILGSTAQSITFTGLPNTAASAGAITLGATSSSALTVSYESTTPQYCQVTGTQLTLLTVGTCSVTAMQPGDDTYAPAAPMTQSFAILQATQTLSFSPLSDLPLGTSPVTLSATATSGLPVGFTTTTTAVCTLSGNVLTLVAQGVCTVSAYQTGNGVWSSAVSVTRSFNVLPRAQTIAFPSPGYAVLASRFVTLNATASSTLAVSYASTTSSVCTVSVNTINLVSPGVCTITASQGGNADWAPAALVTKSLTVLPSYTITTVAGSGAAGFSGDGGPATAASLSLSNGAAYNPAGLATDSSGNVYISDINNNRIRKLTVSTGVLSTFADIQAYGLTFDDEGNAYAAAGNAYPAPGNVRRVDAVTGAITTVAGSSSNTGPLGDGGPATTAHLDALGVALDGNGNLLIADAANARIRKVDLNTGLITTYAGTGVSGGAGVPDSGDGGPATAASLAQVLGVGLDSAGNVYILERYSIRKVDAITGIITTVVGNGACCDSTGEGGPATQAALDFARTLAVDPAGNLYMGDANGIRFVNASSGIIHFIAGGIPAGFRGDGGPAASALLSTPNGIAVDASGNIYVSDRDNERVRMLTPGVGAMSQTISFGSLPDVPFFTPVTLSATASSGLAVTYESQTPTACTVGAGSVNLLRADVCTLTAMQTGNGVYASATPVNQSFTILQVPQTMTFTPVTGAVYGGPALTLSATSSAPGSLPITFSTATPLVCTVNGNLVTMVSAGSCSVTATQPGTVVYHLATATQTFTVAPASQIITFGALSNVALGSGTVTLTATASSGLFVIFTSTTTGVCTVSGNVVTLVAAGTCSITATQPGSANYAAATSVTRSFTVGSGSGQSQTITFPPLSNITYGGTPPILNATASSGLTVTFVSNTPAVCGIVAGTATLLSAGTCSISATQTGNSDYIAATPVTQVFQITQGAQSINFPQPTAAQTGAGAVGLIANATSGLPISFSSTTPSVCTVNGSQVTPINAGSCGITATQPGNANYAAAAAVTRGMSVLASGGIALSLGTGSGLSGQTTEIPINLGLASGPAAAGFQIDLSFDTAKLSFVSARAGAQATAAQKTLASSTPTAGTARLLVTGFNQTEIANGLVAYASFRLSGDFTSGLSIINAGNCAATSAAGSPIFAACVAGAIKYATCDINTDGAFNVADVQLMINEVLGVGTAVHDLNGDASVNVADVQIVINAALGVGCNVP